MWQCVRDREKRGETHCYHGELSCVRCEDDEEVTEQQNVCKGQQNFRKRRNASVHYTQDDEEGGKVCVCMRGCACALRL